MHKTILLVSLAAVGGLFALAERADAQGTAFTYQGRLNNNGVPANGNYDFRFRLAADPLANTYVGGPYLTNSIPVSNGLFTTVVDFGTGLFTGSNYWLEVDVRTNNGGSYATLAPLQALTPTPYAMFANTAGNLSGTVPLSQLPASVVTNNGTGLTLNGTFTGNGANVTNVNAAALNGLNASNFWQTGGNQVSSGQFLGSANNQPLELWVDGGRALRLEPTGTPPNIFPNLIGGYAGNLVDSGAMGATIGGGGTIGYVNEVSATLATIAGGSGNTIQANANDSTIAGGRQNTIGNSALRSTIGGGYNNSIQTNAGYALISGGFNNTIQNNGQYSTYGNTIVGGAGNTIYTTTWDSSILGGDSNSIFTNASYGVIAGGGGNVIQSYTSSSFIGGGLYNTIISGQPLNVIGGGINNTAGGFGHAFVGGGETNLAYGGDAAVAGGQLNAARGSQTFIGGGYGNSAWGNNSVIGGGSNNYTAGTFSVVPGGYSNNASGQYSLAAGQQAQAMHPGAFVWADSQNAPFASTASDQFLVRATGGVGIGTTSPGAQLDVRGDVKLGASGQYFATAGGENLRVVRGIINSSGGTYNGSGFTVTHTGTGTYTLTFTQAFADVPSLLVTAYTAGSPAVANVTSGTTGGYSITTWVGASKADSWWNFVAIGAR